MTDIIDNACQVEQMQRDMAIASARNHAPQSSQKIIDGVVVCRQCEEPIGVKRLAALPGASLCIDCQSLMERR